MFTKPHFTPSHFIFTAFLFALSNTAQAAVTFYDVETSFNTAYSGTLNLENFEGFTAGDPAPIVASDFTLTSSDDGAINESYLGVYATDGDNYFGWAYADDATITFDFNSPIDAFGVDITDLASASSTAIHFENNNGDNFEVLYPFFGTHGALDFFGVTSDTPFSSLTLTFQAAEWAGLDRVQFGTVVPVPATFWLFATGLVALSGAVRKRSR